MEQFLVMHSQLVQHRRVPIVNSDLLVSRLQTDLVGSSMNVSAFDAGTGQPGHHRILIVIATGLQHVLVTGQLGNRQPAEFPTPGQQRAVEQTSLVKILKQRGYRLICLATGRGQARADVGVVVPDLEIDEQLNKPNAPFDQPAGDQATATIRICPLAPHSVPLLGTSGFLGNVQRVRGSQLHSCGKLIAGDPCIQLRLSGTSATMDSIECADQVPFQLHDGLGLLVLAVQIENGLAGGTKTGALVDGRQKPGLPVLHPVDRQPGRIVEHDVGRQILILAAETISDPRPEARQTRSHPAAVGDEQRGFMSQVGRVHRPNETDPIHLGGEVRQQLRHVHSAFTVLGKPKRTPHQCPGRPGILDLTGNLVEIRLAVISSQFLLGIEQVHLAGTTVHEQVDHRLGLRLKMRLLRRLVRKCRLRSQEPVRAIKVARQQPGQCRGAQPPGH